MEVFLSWLLGLGILLGFFLTFPWLVRWYATYFYWVLYEKGDH